MAYASLAEYLAYFERAVDDATPLLEAQLARAQRAIDAHTRRTFEATANATRCFDALRDVRGPALILDTDLCQIASVTNGDGATVTAGQYVTEPRNAPPYYQIVLKSNAGTHWRYTGTPENSIAVVGRWAYSLTAPDDIKEATLQLAKFFYDVRRADAADLNRAIVTGGETILPARWPGTVRDLLVPYRRLI